MKTQVKCPKCDGNGKITAFGHVANGDCFCCNATGFITADVDAARAKLSSDTIRKAEFIMGKTAEDFTTPFWTYARLNAADQFAHQAPANPAFREAFPDFHAHWCEVGRPAFFAAQAAKLAEYNS
jgi:hypothetical protein